MSWRSLLESSPAATAWLLESGLVSAGRRDRRGQLQLAAEPLAGPVFDTGPVGLQSVDRPALAEAVGRVQDRVRGARRPAVVLPTAWVRMHLLEMEKVPSRAGDLNEIVQWRLKKLLPVPPSELRVSASPQGSRNGSQTVLCLTGVERSIAALEAAFRDAGLQPGFVGPAAVVRGREEEGAARLRVQVEDEVLALVLWVGRWVRLVRTKPIAGGDALETLVERELRLTLGFIREELEIRQELELEVATANERVAERVGRAVGETEGLAPAPAAPRPACGPPGMAERLGGPRVDAIRRAVTGRLA